MSVIPRRRFLGNLAGGALLLAAPTLTQAETSLSLQRPLKDRAKEKGLFFGAAVQSLHLKQDPAFRDAIVRECNMIIPEWEMKWGAIEKQEGRANFSAPDWLTDFAIQNNMAVHGHVAVWHINVPEWVKRAFSEGRGEAAMVVHVKQLMEHYKGKLHSMGVVNEAIDPSAFSGSIYRNSLFYENLGKDYISTAFASAHQADPTARLFYSDYGVDYDDRVSRMRRAASLTLLSELKKRDVPVHGYAIQGHLRVERRYKEKVHREYLREIAALGLDIAVTEFDINDSTLPAERTRRDVEVAAHAKAYLDTLFDEVSVEGLATWGLSQKYSWLNHTKPYAREDGELTRGLPLDEMMVRTPLWTAIAQAFDNAPMRSAR